MLWTPPVGKVSTQQVARVWEEHFEQGGVVRFKWLPPPVYGNWSGADPGQLIGGKVNGSETVLQHRTLG